jgi:outer membrane lipoprotein-sorting protein
MVISKVHRKTGKETNEELWIALPSRYCIKSEGGEVADDGRRQTLLAETNGVTTATISPSKGLSGLDPSGSYLALFNFRNLVREFGDKLLSRRSVTLSDGRAATVFDFGDCRFTVDNATNLPVRIEDYWPDGTLRKVIAHIDYNVEIPASLFRPRIPRNAIVIDTLKPSSFSAELEHERSEVATKLEASGAWRLAWRVGVSISSVYDQNTGSVGSPAHPGMRFTPLDAGKAWLFYIPERNSYFVLGRWLVIDERTAGYHLTVQDREFSAPRKAKVMPLPAPRVRMKNGKPGEYEEWTRLQNLGPGPLTIVEEDSWNGGLTYEIRGRAKHIPDGKVYQNESVAFDKLNDLPMDVPYPERLYWGNLSNEETSGLRGYVDYHNRVAAILGNKNAKGYSEYEGAEVQDMGWLDDNVPLCEGKLQLTRGHRPDLKPCDMSQYLGYPDLKAQGASR